MTRKMKGPNEMNRIGRNVFHVYHADPPDGPFDRWDTVALLLIERVENIDVTAPLPSNEPA